MTDGFKGQGHTKCCFRCFLSYLPQYLRKPFVTHGDNYCHDWAPQGTTWKKKEQRRSVLALAFIVSRCTIFVKMWNFKVYYMSHESITLRHTCNYTPYGVVLDPCYKPMWRNQLFKILSSLKYLQLILVYVLSSAWKMRQQ